MTSLTATTTTATTLTVDAAIDAEGEANDMTADIKATEMDAQQETMTTRISATATATATATTTETQMLSDNNPITDIVKETNAIKAVKAVATGTKTTTETTPQLSSPTKIPYLQQQQHTPPSLQHAHGKQLHSPSDSLRRSASLRVRGTKSNLFNVYNSGQFMVMEQQNTRYLNSTQNTTNTVNTIQHFNHPLKGVVFEQQQHDKQESLATTAGSFGGAATATAAAAAATTAVTRHKAAPLSLFGSTLSKQTPAVTVGNLTRSQSLRRSYRNYNEHNLQQKLFKTDIIKKQNLEDVTKVGFGADVVSVGTDNDNVAPLKSNTQRDMAADNKNDVLPNGIVKTMNDIIYKEEEEEEKECVGELKRINKDMQRMSLNLNCNGGEQQSTTTTKKSTLTGTVVTATGTPIGSGSGGCAEIVNTPKTPNNITAISAVRYVKSSPIAAQSETKLTPKTPPVTPDSPCTYLDDDLDSMYSFATTTSGRSTMSCEHPYVARNGTTFSGRKMKYVVHCSNYAGQVGPDYLTPTQRAARQIRRLKELLSLARQDLEQKDSEILRLTREVVELRLFKASLSSPEERSASSDAVTVREADLKTSQDVSPIVDMVDDASKSSPRHMVVHSQHLHQQSSQPHLSSEMQSSFADSGHFEDLSVHSKDSYAANTQDIACGSDERIGVEVAEATGGSGGGIGIDDDDDDDDDDDNEDYAATIKNYELQRQELIRIYEQKIEELIRTQDGASSEMKRSHNDKVEALLQKLAECNTRYADIVPDYEHAKERIRELEKQLEDLQRQLAEHEDKQNKMYLHMYQKGQEAERIARADQALELVHRAPNNKVSINELLHQLQSTQDELENIRVRFFKIFLIFFTIYFCLLHLLAL